MNVITAQKAPALRVERLAKTFDVSAPWLNRVVERKPRQFLHAVNDISFDVPMSGCLSLVGESGCGKSTVARLVTGLYKPNSGEMRFAPGQDGNPLSAQMIFQDPYASLNPRWRVKNIIAEPLRELKLRKTAAEITERVVELLKTVGLSASDGEKFPHEFSGGQRQRISIARALASEPQFLVCDEPTSALDVSVQAQVLNLMRRLQDEFGLTYLFISHDMSVVRHMSDRIAVMYLGRIVEEGETEALFARPRHPYTQLLLQTIPNIEHPHRDRVVAAGEVPSPLNPPSGCPFHPRCPIATARCSAEIPEVRTLSTGTRVACHLAEEA
ncbi:peptide/nickel transport system ATP-binding protein [Mesorhizobium albiziae]|uniref:Peptide/nickel transport system ATP-binding protein n=1 Tax=Neomesorhizobium albiziae TaxID=335020 RepID=A0A1I3VNY4_9HYPH|nr:oligopeptide/dipeptide ABC transporter ATP-binding protein [Mesorhizobium albiziae]GLS29087.1 ABC transporter ATP-binding protein [Mesorhizobium albiziae]SFJ97088.1 peptide/nickel transport system ATP-binding protein [Mesorhizobium albiziae]